MVKRLFFIVIFILIASSCVPKSDLPVCASEDMTLPTTLRPSAGEIVNTRRPTFSWTFEPTAACWPRGFIIRVGIYPMLDLHSYGLVFIETNHGETSLTPSFDALENCREYYWAVEVPVSPVGSIYSHISSFRTDFTGSCTWMADCSIETIPPIPYAFRPLDEEGIDTLNPELIWQPHTLTCDPIDYYYEVSDAPDFATKIIEGTTTQTIHEEPSNYLEDCSTYYWRVTARNGSLISTSRINQFWTYLEPCFLKPDCTSEQLIADTPIYPIGGETITDPRPYLVWKANLPGCLPEISAVIVSERRDLSGFLLRASFGTGTTPSMDHTIYSSPDEIYQDCTTYYWGRRLIADGVSVWSGVESFYTNFDGHCLTSIPPISSVIDHIRFDCINPNLTVILFELKQPIQGNFEARIGDDVWPCETQSGNENLLICTGPWTKENVKTQITLYDKTTGTEAFSGQVTTPICEVANPTPCQPPAGGCKATCHWDSTQCDCLNANNGPCQ